MEQQGGWGFFTNHTRVLLAVARDPDTRIRDVAAACRITDRTVQSILADLEQDGYVSRERVGRRTHYTLCPDGRPRHPAEARLSVAALLELFTHPTAKTKDAAAADAAPPEGNPSGPARPGGAHAEDTERRRAEAAVTGVPGPAAGNP